MFDDQHRAAAFASLDGAHHAGSARAYDEDVDRFQFRNLAFFRSHDRADGRLTRSADRFG